LKIRGRKKERRSLKKGKWLCNERKEDKKKNFPLSLIEKKRRRGSLPLNIEKTLEEKKKWTLLIWEKRRS